MAFPIVSVGFIFSVLWCGNSNNITCNVSNIVIVVALLIFMKYLRCN